MIPLQTQRHTKGGVDTKEIWEDGIPKGWECRCPFCNEINRALYDEEGEFGQRDRLINWPNTEIGTWCPHATGAYAGARPTGAPQFLFR